MQKTFQIFCLYLVTHYSNAAETITRLPDGSPDMSSVWMGSGSNSADIRLSLKPGEELILLPWVVAHMQTLRSQNDPRGNCLPSGIPRSSPYPWRMIQDRTHQAPNIIFILFEGNIHSYHQIFMDKRGHPEDLTPKWFGHSTGEWQGDTLAVDTVGFNDRFWVDYLGHPHTEQLHIVERYTRTSAENMSIEVSIEDPGTYAKNFTTAGKATLLPGGDLLEYICNEKNIDLQHVDAPAQLP